MEFLLQLMAELFDTESKPQEIGVIAETSKNEAVSFNIQAFQPELEDIEDFSEGSLIFDFIHFH